MTVWPGGTDHRQFIFDLEQTPPSYTFVLLSESNSFVSETRQMMKQWMDKKEDIIYLSNTVIVEEIYKKRMKYQIID